MNPRLSVACLSVSASLGGSERVLLDFASRASDLGIDALVVVPKGGPLVDLLREAGVATEIAPATEGFLEITQRRTISAQWLTELPHGLWAWAREIRAALVRHFGSSGGPEVLYSNGFKAHLTGSLLRGPRKVWHLHEFPPGNIGAFWRLVAGALPDALIANSASVADAWRIPLRRPPATVLNGVDLDRFVPTSRSFWIHEQLELPRSARLIGMPAVFARWKGQIEVVDAFVRVAERAPDAHLVLAGGTIYDTAGERHFAAQLVKHVARASTSPLVANRIHFLKFQRDPWRLYPEFEFTVHFSLRPEPFGRVIAESLACGVPVIAARAGGPTEIVEDGVTGWLVRPKDTECLGRAILEALATDLGAFRSASRKYAEQQFSADRFAREVAGILHEARPRHRGTTS